MTATPARAIDGALARMAPLFVPRTRVYGALAQAAAPTPELSVAEWAERRRYVAPDSGSSRPGKWTNATTPFAVEMMECLAPDHPAHLVTLKCASQLVKTEIGLNWIGQTIDVDPAPFLVLEPSLDEVRLFSATRFEPMAAATPSLRGKVFEVVERSRAGSTTKTKRFRGGVMHIASAGASKDLQQKSVKRVFADEVSEYPEDSGGRGDPLDQAITRTDGHPDYKVLAASTPKDLPNCRITNLYEKGDQRQFYVPCPHCAGFQILVFEQLVAGEHETVSYACALCGALIGEEHKPGMLAAGVWLKTYNTDDADNPAPPPAFEAVDLERWRGRHTDGREPSFYLSQLYSPFKPWTRLMREASEADTQEKRKTFRQQKLGLAWDPAIDAPDHKALFDARGVHVRRGIVPAWACLITVAADVQNDRIEWAAYAWGPDKSGARIDFGVCEGDTATDAPWIELAGVASKTWPGEATMPLSADAFVIDSGGGAGRTAKVYQFVRRSVGLKAIKGASKHDALPFAEGGMGKVKGAGGKYVTAKIHLIGGWGVKKTIYAMLFRALAAQEMKERLPYGLYYPDDTPEEHFKQLTAEVFKEPRSRRAGAVGTWERISGRANEQLDLAVYAYAAAWDKGLERFGPTEWAKLFAARALVQSDAPLFDFAARESALQAETPGAVGSTATPEPAAASASAHVEAAAKDATPQPAQDNAPPKATVPKNPGVARGLPAWMQALAEQNKGSGQ